MFKDLEKIYLKTIKWLSLLVLFIPLFVFRETLYPYIFPKIIAFQVLVEIIFVVWLILIIKNEEYRPNFKHPVVLALTIFISVLILTMITGVDISRSFFSTQERMTGVLTMLHFYGWFLVLGSCFKKWKDWRKFIWVSLGVSFLIGLYGIGQTLGFEFLMKGTGKRMSSTLGNPIYLSVFSMLHVFLAGFLFFIERKKILKGILLFLSLFNLIIMLLGASRAVAVSFGLSVCLFLLFLVFILPSKKWKILMAVLLIFIIGGGVFMFQNRGEGWMRGLPYFANRLLRSKFERTLWKRTEAWEIAFKGFQEKPITGWGWENYNIVFNKYYNPRYSGTGKTWYDRSHNQVMDIMVLMGILGTVSYFLLFFFIFFFLFKRTKKENSLGRKIALGILAVMFVSYFLQNLFVFDTPGPLIVFYFSLGLICFVTTKDKVPEREKKERRFSENGTNALLIFLVILGLAFSLYKFNVKPTIHSNLAVRAAKVSVTDFSGGFNLYKKALIEPSFTNPETRIQLGNLILKAKGKVDIETIKEGFQFTVSEMKKSIEEHPLDVRHYLNLGLICNKASNIDSAFLKIGEEYLEKGKQLSPLRPEIYNQLGWSKLLQDKEKEALDVFEEAVNLNRSLSTPRWFLGLALLANENYQKGIKEIETAIKLGGDWGKDPNIILFIAQGYGAIENYEKAALLCNIALEIDPKSIKALGQKAIYLIQDGKRKEAEKTIERLSEIEPETAERLKEILESF